MLVTRVSPFDMVTRTMDLDVTQEQMDDYKNRKGLIQNIFPNLTADEREFIMTGITPDQWDNMFTEDD